MTVFILIGILFTLLVAAGGVVAARWLGKRTGAEGGKRRHREEARRLQERFEADEDFTRNFHRPTQNELLETLQALDHLTLDWESGDEALVEHRFKNELAESFPTLCKAGGRYPEPIAEDLSRLFGKGKLSASAMDERQRNHNIQISRSRAAFHAARAQANAMHQITSGPAVGPVAMAPGSLPFQVRDDARSRPRRVWLPKLAVAAAVLAGVLMAGWQFLRSNDGAWKQFEALVYSSPAPNHSTVPAPFATPAATVAVVSPPSSPSPEVIAAASPSPMPEVPEAVATTPAPPVGTPEPVVAQTQPAPPPSVAPVPPPAPATQATPSLAQQVADSKMRAIERFPDLAVPNSEINSRFIFRYKKMAEEKNARLQDPNWPEKLAEECAAAALGSKGRKITQARPERG